MYFDPELVVPDESLRLSKDAIASWANSGSQYYTQTLESIAKHLNVDPLIEWKKLNKTEKHLILYGSGQTYIKLVYDDGKKAYELDKE